MSITHDYTVALDWREARKGELSSVDFSTNIEVATPPEFPGGMPGYWSPEHLFVAAVSSCFMTTFLSIAENSRLGFTHFSCRASGRLEKLASGYQITTITLFPEVTLENIEEEEKTLRILNKTEANCLISNSIRTKIMMRPTISSATVRTH